MSNGNLLEPQGIYTVNIRSAQKIRLDYGIHVEDITVKTGNLAFAPTWQMVLDYKGGRLSEQEYTEQYKQMMRHSYNENRQEWERLLSIQQLALACYCPKKNFCHRHLLARMLESIHISRGNEVCLYGEILHETVY